MRTSEIVRTMDFRVIGIANQLLADTNKEETYLFLTKNMTDDILECNMDAYFKIEDRVSFFKSEAKKVIESNKERANEQVRIGFTLGEKIKASLDTNDEILNIETYDPFIIKGDVCQMIIELYQRNRYLLDSISVAEKNRISILDPVFCNIAEVFNRTQRILFIVSDNLTRTYDDVKYKNFNKKVKSFYKKYEKDTRSADNLLLDIPITLKDFICGDKSCIQTIRELNSYLYQFCEYKDYLIQVNELLSELGKIMHLDLECEVIPKLKGKSIKVSHKCIQKSSVRAHIRKMKMSKQKREEVIWFLEENDLIIDGLGIITKDNFETFDWNKMTIVDGFEKNIKGVILDNNKTIDNYIDKEQERQRKLDLANLIHQRLVRQMAYTLSEANISPKYNRFIDLYCEKENHFILFEMKSITPDNCYSQLLKAFSQLMAYPYICNLDKNVLKCVVLNEKPTEDRFESLFRDNNINIIWMENNIFTTYDWSDSEIVNLLMDQVIIQP